MVDLNKIKGPAAWPKARAEVEALVLGVLGKLPKTRADLQLKIIDEVEFPGYVRKRINYFVDDWARISAWLFVPEGKDELPAILCCHQEAGQGKDETAGLEGDAAFAFAKRYAQMGFVTLAVDCITAGERVSSNSEPFDTKLFYKDFPKMSLAGKMLADHIQAIDVLLEVTRVDPSRIGVAGHGLGALNALLLAAFDERVIACVASCGFTRFAKNPDPGALSRETAILLLPKLKTNAKTPKLPFDWEHVLALCAPSATFIITSLANANYVHPESCDDAVNTAQKLYKLLGAPAALDHYTHEEGHYVSQTTHELADEWFERWL